MVSRFAAFALAFSTSVFALTAYAETTAPITDIRLSSGGLAEIRRQVEVKDSSSVTLTVPLDQVDDVLKSLKISDPKGTASSASLAGKEPLSEAFKNLPFSASDLSSQSALMAALQGAAVTVAGEGRETRGRIVGVEIHKIQDKNGETIDNYRLAIFSGGKLTAFDLGKVDVTLDDSALRAKLESGLDAVQAAKAGDARDIAVSLTGTGSRNVAIDYVVPAPVWKATYRLTLPKDGDKADLQGWAVIENTSADDWKNVRLSLSSGSPVTLHQRLHEAYYAMRPNVPVYGPNGIVPLADKGGENIAKQEVNQSWGKLKLADALHQIRSAPAVPQSEEADVTGGAKAVMDHKPSIMWNAPLDPIRFDYAYALGVDKNQISESDISTLFTLATPVSLIRGQSLTLPFLTAKMTASRISVFQPQLGIPNPVAAVMVKNEGTTSLPPGILILTEDGSGYAGDAQLAGLPAGETRMVMFATDRKVVISSNSSGKQRVSKIVYDNGALKADTASETSIIYKIKGAQDADRTVIIEYPRRPGLTYTSPQKESETPTAIRLKINVPKGGAAEAQITEQQTMSTAYSLADMENNSQAFAFWSQQASSDPKLLAKIKDASDALTKVNAAKLALGNYDGEVERIKSDQERIRDNLQAVPAASDLAKTYLATMTTQEKRLTEIASLREKGEETLKAARAELSNKLKAF